MRPLLIACKSPRFVAGSLLAALAMSCQQGLTPASSGTTTLGREDMARLAAAAQLPTQAAAGEPSRPAGGQGVVTLVGHVTLSPKIKDKLRAGDTVFVMARDAETRKIVAVSRFMAAHPDGWPMPYELADDRLIQGQSVHLSVRIDKDGDASTKQAGDLVGERTAPATVPASAIEVEVSDMLP